MSVKKGLTDNDGYKNQLFSNYEIINNYLTKVPGGAEWISISGWKEINFIDNKNQIPIKKLMIESIMHIIMIWIFLKNPKDKDLQLGLMVMIKLLIIFILVN